MMALSGVRISWEIFARKSDFADEARSAVRLALSRSSSARFHCVMSRSTAQNFGMPSPMRPHGHEQRDQPALAHAADHLAPVVEHARDAVLGQPVEIVARDALALRREQLGERAARHLVILVAEQRLGRAVEARG